MTKQPSAFSTAVARVVMGAGFWGLWLLGTAAGWWLGDLPPLTVTARDIALAGAVLTMLPALFAIAACIGHIIAAGRTP
jgi:hypothetical protein